MGEDGAGGEEVVMGEVLFSLVGDGEALFVGRT